MSETENTTVESGEELEGLSDSQPASNLGSDNMKVSSSERRSPSPGVAKRLITTANSSNTDIPEPSASGTEIDDLSKKLADSLLEKNTAATQPPKYVSMNEKRKKDVEAFSGLETVPAAVHDKKLTESISINTTTSTPTTLTNGSNGQLTNGQNPTNNLSQAVDLGLWISKERDLDNPWAAGLDRAATLNISKSSSNGGNSSIKPLTDLDSASKDMSSLADENLISAEVDILTAISAQATPSSLPNVLDGLSDGEISSDDDDSADDEAELSGHLTKQVELHSSFSGSL